MKKKLYALLLFSAVLLSAALPALCEGEPPVVLDASVRQAHAGDLSLTEVIISGDCKGIGPRAFADCKNLRSVYIPLHLEEIANDAFEGCEDLTLYGYKGIDWPWAGKHGFNYVSLEQVSPELCLRGGL